jgi:alkylated DNA repair dioxygenase AlkB
VYASDADTHQQVQATVRLRNYEGSPLTWVEHQFPANAPYQITLNHQRTAVSPRIIGPGGGGDGGGDVFEEPSGTVSAPGYRDQAFTVELQLPPPPWVATFVSQSVPSSVAAGQRFPVSVTMRNAGSTTWTSGGTNPVRLGSQNPQDNTTWGLGRVELPGPVAEDAQVTFQFTATAPSAPGSYHFQWRMVHEGVAWFGDLTPDVAVTVNPPPPDPAGNGSAFVSQIVPTSMVVGDDAQVSVTMRNTGRTTWYAGGAHGFRLGSQDPQDNQTWGLNRVDVPQPVAPGQQVTFSFTVTPARIGLVPFQWQMVQETVNWFGPATPVVNVTVRRPIILPGGV